MGDKATPDIVKEKVMKTVQDVEEKIKTVPSVESPFERFILIAAGMNRTDVTARITGSLSNTGCNIQDITQKMMGDFFTLSVLVDVSNSKKGMDQIKKDMDLIAGELGIKIYIQHEEFFH